MLTKTRFAKRLVVSRVDITQVQHVRGQIKELQELMQGFAFSLPASFIFSKYNLQLRAYSHQLPRFLMVHIWWHQCHCDLYRLFLKGHRLALPSDAINLFDTEFVSHCQERCLEHAISIVDILSTLLHLDVDLPLMDLDMATCIYHAARILYHTYRTQNAKFGLTEELVHDKAQICMSVLEKLPSGSPMTELYVGFLYSHSLNDTENSIQKTDLQNLMDPQKTQTAPSSRSTSPAISEFEAQPSTARPHNLLFRHAFLRSSRFVDDSEALAMPKGRQISSGIFADSRDTSSTFLAIPVSGEAQPDSRPQNGIGHNRYSQQHTDLGVDLQLSSNALSSTQSNNFSETALWDTTIFGLESEGLADYEVDAFNITQEWL